MSIGPALRLCAAAALAAVAAAAPAQAKSRSAEEVRLARDYALVACIRHRYPDSELAAEVQIWARGLVERGNVAADFYGKLARYVRETAPAPESSKPGVAMRMKSCIDLYNSPALTTEIRKLMRE
jgi:hypothetical protein